MSTTQSAIALLSAGVPASEVSILSAERGVSPNFDVVWQSAIELGAPVSQALEELSRYERSQTASEHELEQSLALPKATKRLMLWLPVFGVALSQTFGLNPFAGFSNPLGVFAFGVAIFLLFLGDKLAEKMISKLEKNSTDENLPLLIFAVALKSGISLSEAKSFLQKKFPKQNLELDPHIDFAYVTGAPVSKILVCAAQENHEAKTSRAIQDAKALSVKLLIPLGLTVLPAFLLLTVVPILISQITT